jgi:serpin B
MVLVVPKDGAFDAVSASLSGDTVSQLFASLSEQNVSVQLPKFTVQGNTISLSEELKQMGMEQAFSDSADFSALTTTESVKVDDVLHEAFIKVDEDGTEAAAATAITGVAASAVLDLKFVNVDHPFFYFIRDIPTNTVLFVGRETDPSAA